MNEYYKLMKADLQWMISETIDIALSKKESIDDMIDFMSSIGDNYSRQYMDEKILEYLIRQLRELDAKSAVED